MKVISVQLWKIYTTFKGTNYGYKSLNIRSTFFLNFFLYLFFGLVANTEVYICLEINIFLEDFCCHTAFKLQF